MEAVGVWYCPTLRRLKSMRALVYRSLKLPARRTDLPAHEGWACRSFDKGIPASR